MWDKGVRKMIQNPDYNLERKEDTTYEDELLAYAEMQLGRKVNIYPRQTMGKKNDGQLEN